MKADRKRHYLIANTLFVASLSIQRASNQSFAKQKKVN